MKIHVICRLNQARSIIAAAAIRKLYPELEVYSSGIQAQSGSPIPVTISDIAERWGLTDIDHTSTLFADHPPIDDEDFVFCADSSIFHHLQFLGVPGRLIDVTQAALERSLVPHDPVMMSPLDMEEELAKMVVATIMSLTSVRPNNNRHAIIAFLYDQPNETMKNAVDSWLRQSQGLAIDMSWRIPDLSLWQSLHYQVALFNPRQLSPQLSSELSGAILCSEFEVDSACQILTSQRWMDYLHALNRPICLLIQTAPTFALSPGENILSLLHSDHYRYFPSTAKV